MPVSFQACCRGSRRRWVRTGRCLGYPEKCTADNKRPLDRAWGPGHSRCSLVLVIRSRDMRRVPVPSSAVWRRRVRGDNLMTLTVAVLSGRDRLTAAEFSVRKRSRLVWNVPSGTCGDPAAASDGSGSSAGSADLNGEICNRWSTLWGACWHCDRTGAAEDDNHKPDRARGSLHECRPFAPMSTTGGICIAGPCSHGQRASAECALQ